MTSNYLFSICIGATYPKNGQTAVVHYTGTLQNGTVFDSSRTRGKPFRFTIGQGEVIRGWDEGVAKVGVLLRRPSIILCDCFRIVSFNLVILISTHFQLSVGERAKLVCSPDYAYGSRGHPGVIPPNAILTFDVELLKVE